MGIEIIRREDGCFILYVNGQEVKDFPTMDEAVRYAETMRKRGDDDGKR